MSPLDSSRRLPPGPRSPAPVQLAQWVTNPIALLESCRERYGATFRLRLPGGYTGVFFTDLAAVKEIFQGDPTVFSAGEASEPFEPFVGRNSLFLLEGALHRRHRALLAPPFHGERMHALTQRLLELVRTNVASWPQGRSFPLYDQMHRIAYDIIVQALFGASPPTRLTRMSEVFGKMLAAGLHPLLLFRPFRTELGPLTPWARFLALKRDASACLRVEIEARRRGEVDGDILAMLVQARDANGVGLNDEELQDEIASLFLAGHETTAASLTWAFHHILQTPGIEAKVHEELTRVFGDGNVSPEKMPELKYIDATIKETQRHSPVFPMVGRVLQKDAVVGGWQLPARTMVAPCIYLIQRRDDLWPDPTVFEPQRFLDVRGEPPGYLPFGGGARRCLGAVFAILEMKVVLAEVFRGVRLRVAPGYTPRFVRRSVTLVPSEGMPVIAERLQAERPARRSSSQATG